MKQKTLEETYLNELIDEANKEFTLDKKLAKEVAIKFSKWQEQRMYSEEEVKDIVEQTIEKFYKHFYTLTKAEMKEQWFEKIKKK